MPPSRKKLASEAARLLASLGASKGGKASAAALTPEERRARAKAAIAARWAKRPMGELPIDQAAVMARLEGKESVTLRIAPGGGGVRRRNAIHALERAGKLRLLAESVSEVTIGHPGARTK